MLSLENFSEKFIEYLLLICDHFSIIFFKDYIKNNICVDAAYVKNTASLLHVENLSR